MTHSTKPLTPEQKKDKIEAAIIRNATDRPKRAERGSFNGTKGKLSVRHGIEGYHLHIFNDKPGRIEEALHVGYDFVKPSEVGGVQVNTVSRNTDIGDKVRYIVGTTEDNQPLYAYLMKIPLEEFEEDQAELQAQIDLTEEAIRGGKITGDGYSTEGRYIPREGIKMTQK